MIISARAYAIQDISELRAYLSLYLSVSILNAYTQLTHNAILTIAQKQRKKQRIAYLIEHAFVRC